MNLIYEGINHFVIKKEDYYEIYKIGITCSTRCGICYDLDRAINECKKRDKENI